MIAIDTIITAKNLSEVDEDYIVLLVRKSYDNVYNFFKDCIDQNLVLNATFNYGSTSRFFATTIENAQAFQNAYSDMSADFSIKKMLDENGFDVSFEQHEINFDNEIVLDLIDSNGYIFNILPPSSSNVWNRPL